MKQPKFSLIMPAFNAVPTLRAAIFSLIEQTYANFELIIIDDGSSDSTYRLAKKFSEKDTRIKVLRIKKNSGAATAMNLGISKARFEWIAIVDSDAVEPKDWLLTASQVALKENIDIFGGGVLHPKPSRGYWKTIFYFFEKLTYPKNDIIFSRTTNLSEPPIAGANSFFRKEAIDKHGKFNENIRAGYDRFYIMRLIENGLTAQYVSKLYIKHPLYDYRDIRSFLNRSIFFMRWRNTFLKDSPTMNYPYKKAVSLLAGAIIAGCMLSLVVGAISTIWFIVGVLITGVLILCLRKIKTIPLLFIPGYVGLDIIKKLISITLYVTRSKPNKLDWAKR